jgi:DNA mismatch repair protein MutS2
VTYPENFEQKIEFQKIRQYIIDQCLSTLGKERTENMSFSSSFDEIQRWLKQTEEFVRILQEEDAFPSDNFFDVRPMLKRIRIEGSWIEQQTLFELRRSLQTIHGIVSFLRRDDEKEPRYPQLRALTENVAI